jgi:tetratricopeptide (TPR) repeat protein
VNALALALALAIAVAGTAPLEEGRAHWRVMELEKAAAKFETAVTLAKDESARAEALVWLGVVNAELGEFPRAKSAFVSALRLRGDVALPSDAGEIAPRVRGLFEAAKLEVEGPRPLPRDPLPEVAEVREPSRADEPTTAEPTRPPVDEAREGDEGPPLLVVGAIALAGSGVMLLGTAAIVDVAAGPELLDGGAVSVVCLGAGGVMLLAGAALGALATMQ